MSTLSIQQLITNTAAAAGVPPALALQVARQESSLNPNAMGSKGELGLFQLMPSTAAALGVTNPLDPIQNTQGGVAYLAQLFQQFGSWDAALAAYNWGPQNVANAQRAAGSNWLSLAPSSTQGYVAGALSATGISPAPAAAPTSPAAAPSFMPSIDQASFVPALPADTGSNPLLLALLALGIWFGARLLFSEA